MLNNRKDWFRFSVALLVVGFSIWVSSGAPVSADICDQGSQAEVKDCATYNIIFVLFWHIREWLHYIEGIVTALATIAIAWFTWTLWQSNERMWGTTKVAADAAKASAAALPIIEGAYVYPEV